MLMKIKTFFMDLFIKTMVTHPGFMESKLFLKVMLIFPEMISSHYDASVVKEGGNYKNVIRAGLMSIQNKPHRILDVCTGTGVASFIANQVFPESKIVSIDQSEGMIKIAQSKADKMGLSSIEFKLDNALQLAEPDHSFDLIPGFHVTKSVNLWNFNKSPLHV